MEARLLEGKQLYDGPFLTILWDTPQPHHWHPLEARYGQHERRGFQG
jgi:hypothetical protein